MNDAMGICLEDTYASVDTRYLIQKGLAENSYSRDVKKEKIFPF